MTDDVRTKGLSVFLADYDKPDKYWKVTAEDGVIRAFGATSEKPTEFVAGIFHLLVTKNGEFPVGYFSRRKLPSLNAPDYRADLVVLAGGRLWGDGFNSPVIRFRRGFLVEQCEIFADDKRRCFSYRSHPVKEFLRKLNSGGTIDYQPVQFMESLRQVVTLNRPYWLGPSQPDYKR